jgi:hypothetical protein
VKFLTDLDEAYVDYLTSSIHSDFTFGILLENNMKQIISQTLKEALGIATLDETLRKLRKSIKDISFSVVSEP